MTTPSQRIFSMGEQSTILPTGTSLAIIIEEVECLEFQSFWILGIFVVARYVHTAQYQSCGDKT